MFIVHLTLKKTAQATQIHTEHKHVRIWPPTRVYVRILESFPNRRNLPVHDVIAQQSGGLRVVGVTGDQVADEYAQIQNLRQGQVLEFTQRWDTRRDNDGAIRELEHIHRVALEIVCCRSRRRKRSSVCVKVSG